MESRFLRNYAGIVEVYRGEQKKSPILQEHFMAEWDSWPKGRGQGHSNPISALEKLKKWNSN